MAHVKYIIIPSNHLSYFLFSTGILCSAQLLLSVLKSITPWHLIIFNLCQLIFLPLKSAKLILHSLSSIFDLPIFNPSYFQAFLQTTYTRNISFTTTTTTSASLYIYYVHLFINCCLLYLHIPYNEDDERRRREGYARLGLEEHQKRRRREIEAERLLWLWGNEAAQGGRLGLASTGGGGIRLRRALTCAVADVAAMAPRMHDITLAAEMGILFLIRFLSSEDWEFCCGASTGNLWGSQVGL